jgi:small subunit ribosomal protein S20
VAHSLSAKKRIRQTEKHRARNRARKDTIKAQTKSFQAAAAAGDTVKAQVELNKLTAKLDRTAAQHTIHKNTAARKRSRLTRKLNALKKTAGSK